MTFTPEEVTAAIVVAHNIDGREIQARNRVKYPNAAWAQREYEEISAPDWDEFGSPLSTTLGEIKVIEEVGGEGQGDHAHVVIQTVTTGQYFKIDGYYTSYDGTDWDYAVLREVRPVTKTVVVYE